MSQIIFNTAGDGTWTAPSDGTLTVEGIGAGASGWIASNNNGGAGADYAKAVFTVVLGDGIAYHVPALVPGTTGAAMVAGDDAWVKNAAGTIVMLAKGGGSLSTSVGSLIHAGGAVGASGGGGAGGPVGPGLSSTSIAGGGGDGGSGAGGVGGATGGANGGAGTEWGTVGSGGGGAASVAGNGGAGGLYGAGGGGARSGHTAGAGQMGLLVFTFVPTDKFSGSQQLEDVQLTGEVTDTPPPVDSFTGSQQLDDVAQSSTGAVAPHVDDFGGDQQLGGVSQTATGSVTPHRITSDVQKLDPGAEIRLYELDGSQLGASVLRFHGYPQVGTITWQGNEYLPWPIEAVGFEKTSDQQGVPTVTVGNIDGSISALCLAFDDMLGAKVTVHITMGMYLDAVNFGGVNPTADPTQEIAPDVWFIERKASEDSEQVSFELSNGLNLQNRQLPGRQIIANVCSWVAIGGYRGPFCGYTGGPVADVNDNPTADPDQDDCSGTLVGCKFRFGDFSELPYGGFPAAGLLRT